MKVSHYLVAGALSALLLVLGSCASAGPAKPKAVVPADLVTGGVWSSDVDKEGKVVPTKDQPEGLLKTVDGQKVIEVTWNLRPDKANGGDIWTWGELNGTFDKDKDPGDLSKKTIELTYSSTGATFVRFIQDPPVTEDGAQHRFPLDPTKGAFVTIELDPEDFVQPGWRQFPIGLHMNSITTFQIVPNLPGGGECKVQIKSVKLTDKAAQ